MNHRDRGAARRSPTVALPTRQRPGQRWEAMKPDLKREVERPAAGTPKAAEPPLWVGNLLSVVHYNFPKGLVLFCVSCDKGLYQERHFEEGGSHHGHKRVRMYDFESSICVNSLDMKNLNVDTAEIEEFIWLDPGVDPAVFMFMHNTFGYANEPRNGPAAELPWKKCSHCNTKLQRKQLGLTKTRFCCLDCQIRFLSRVKSKFDQMSTRIVSPEQPKLPPYESHLRDVSFAQMLRRDHGSTSRTLEDNVQYNAGNDVSSQHGPEQCHDLDVAVDEILDPLDPRDERKSTRKFTQQYGLETGFEEEISPLRRSDSDFKVESVSEAQVVFQGTPPADGSGYRQATLQRERGAAEQRCSAGADSSESWYATVHELRHAGGRLSADIDHSPNAREVDQIGLPEDLYEDQLHVLLTPRAKILSPMHITAPPGSPKSSPEALNAKLHPSYVNSKPVEIPNRVHPECASGLTPNLFRKALAAASCSSNTKWRGTPKTNAETKGDGDLDGEGMGTMEPLRPTPKSLDDNSLRKAALVLCSISSEFENSDYAINEADTGTSIQSSSSPGGPVRSRFSNSPPKVHKVVGPIDFKSLKQLASTFDPLRWILEVRSPGVVLNLPAVPGHAL